MVLLYVNAMLNVYFGDMPDAIYNTNIYFNNTYKDSWIVKPLSKDMIKAVDQSDVIDEKTIPALAKARLD